MSQEARRRVVSSGLFRLVVLRAPARFFEISKSSIDLLESIFESDADGHAQDVELFDPAFGLMVGSDPKTIGLMQRLGRFARPVGERFGRAPQKNQSQSCGRRDHPGGLVPRHGGRERKALRIAPSGGELRSCALEDALGQLRGGFWKTQRAEPDNDPFESCEELGARIAGGKMRAKLPRERGRERPFQIIRPQFFTTSTNHDTSSRVERKSPRLRVNLRASSMRPRLMRDLTVPSGTFSCFAISP